MTEPKAMTPSDAACEAIAALKRMYDEDVKKTAAFGSVVEAIGRKDAAAVKAGMDRYAEAVEAGGNHLLGAMQLLEKLAVHLAAKASPPKPAAKRPRIISAEQRKFIYDGATRIVAAEIKELTRRTKHADTDRAKFNSWCRTYFQDGGKLAAYVERVAEPIVGDAAGSVARAVCRDALDQFSKAADPAEQLQYWETSGVEWTANPFFDALYLAAKEKEESRQLAACA